MYPTGKYDLKWKFWERLDNGEEKEVACFLFTIKIFWINDKSHVMWSQCISAWYDLSSMCGGDGEGAMVRPMTMLWNLWLTLTWIMHGTMRTGPGSKEEQVLVLTLVYWRHRARALGLRQHRALCNKISWAESCDSVSSVSSSSPVISTLITSSIKVSLRW